MFWSSKLTIYAIPIKVFTMNETGLIIEVKNIIITIYRFALGLSGSLLIVSLLYRALLYLPDLESSKSRRRFLLIKIINWLIGIGQFTISIYILQKFTLEYAFKFGHVHMPLFIAYLLFLPISIIECQICFMLAKLMLKNEFTQILVGKYN